MHAFWASGPQQTAIEVDAPQTASGPNSAQSALVAQLPQNEPGIGGPAQTVVPSVVCLHVQLALLPQSKSSDVAHESAPGAQPPGGTTQTPPTHSSVSSQASPQAPQWASLWSRSTQSPSQQRSPSRHRLSQLPQCFSSVSSFLHLPSQFEKSSLHRHFVPLHLA